MTTTTRRRLLSQKLATSTLDFDAVDEEKTNLVVRRRDGDAGADKDLPYGGKVFLARKKKPDTWLMFCTEVSAIMVAVSLFIYGYFFFENLHFHIHYTHAHLGNSHAQHVVGQKYMKGTGVKKNHDLAFQWFRKAADNGHPQAAYNLAVAHLKGHKVKLKKGEVRELIKTAADKGMEEAQRVLDYVCTRGHCDNE